MSLKVIIRTPNHLGDCIMALPAINEAREAHPGSSITVLAPEHLGDLFRQNPGIDRVVTMPADGSHGFLGVLRARDLVTADKYDIGYVLPPSFGAASVFKLAGIPVRIGYVSDGRRFLLTRPLPLPSPLNSVHRSRLYFDLLRRGSAASIEYVYPKLILNTDDMVAGDELLSGFGVSPDDEYVVIAFRAVAESRRWGSEKYASLAAKLIESLGLKVALIGSGADAEEGSKIVAGVDEAASEGRAGDRAGRVCNLAGKTSLRELAAVCARARLFVGNDSGPAHLAAATGIPLVVLSGADDPRETSPISDYKSLVYHDHLECISCVKNKCPLKDEAYMRCLRDISVATVVDQVTKLLSPD